MGYFSLHFKTDYKKIGPKNKTILWYLNFSIKSIYKILSWHFKSVRNFKNFPIIFTDWMNKSIKLDFNKYILIIIYEKNFIAGLCHSVFNSYYDTTFHLWQYIVAKTKPSKSVHHHCNNIFSWIVAASSSCCAVMY